MLEQRNIPWLGALVESLYTSLPILSIINFLSITTILYATLKEYLVGWLPWITLGWFLLFLGSITLIVMVLTYLLVLPSIWTFRNKQMNKFESDILTEIRKLREEINKDVASKNLE